jgi:DNA helicase-2/ATP-dependent DNA helicase PcrA
VFIVGLEDGIFPHAQSQWTQDELEEERRLMYVGITRAKEKLYLLYARSRLLYGNYQNNIPSRFLSEIPVQYLHRMGAETAEYQEQKITQATASQTRTTVPSLYKDGDHIHHKSWGEGIIVQIKGDVATIAFQDPTIGIKKLALNIAPLEKIESG